jgi:glycosyltransferase involved in cell wall biosynthesis
VRVLALAHQWIPEHCAGAELMLHGMLRALSDRGHSVVVRLSRQAGPSYLLDGVMVVPNGATANYGLRDVLDAEVVVTHLENTPAAATLGRLNGVPVVQVLHNTMPITREWLLREPPAFVVANSVWMQREVIGWFASRPRPRVIVVRPPVHAADYATTPGDRVTLINLRKMERNPGGLVMGKGVELFWRLAERMPDVQFLGVRGAYGSQLVCELPNVEVLPHVCHDQMRDRVYARTRVLLMPSSYESWGRTGVEAMCSGIPVIAHPTPGLVESLGEAGIFADRDDPDAWVQALRALDDSDRYLAASQRSRARAAELDPTDDLIRWCEEIEALGR